MTQTNEIQNSDTAVPIAERKNIATGQTIVRLPSSPTLGACAHGHVGTMGDVCTAIGCNGTPFR